MGRKDHTVTEKVLKERILSPQVREAEEGTWSNCLRIGDLIMVSGLTARGADGVEVVGADEYEQAVYVFEKIRNLVNAAGAHMDDIVKMTIFVTNIKNNAAVWKARREFFTGDFPACTLVEVAALSKKELLLEIEATAIAGCSGN